MPALLASNKEKEKANQEKGGLGGQLKACPEVNLCGLISPPPNAK